MVAAAVVVMALVVVMVVVGFVVGEEEKYARGYRLFRKQPDRLAVVAVEISIK